MKNSSSTTKHIVLIITQAVNNNNKDLNNVVGPLRGEPIKLNKLTR